MARAEQISIKRASHPEKRFGKKRSREEKFLDIDPLFGGERIRRGVDPSTFILDLPFGLDAYMCGACPLIGEVPLFSERS